MTAPPLQHWPDRLWIVRHGQSAGNVAADAANAAGVTHINLDIRDVDVPLSDLGHRQAEAVAAWFAGLEHGPQVILNSPFVRACETAEAISDRVCQVHARATDERLREREFGILDRLTRSGVVELHPDQAAALTMLGKFYHRPPGGESWTDVILRLRGILDTVALHYAGQRVLIVAHQVVVLCMRYILEGLDERQILAIDAQAEVANCSITEYRFDAGRPVLERYNFVAPLAEARATVTRAPDASVAAG